MQDIKSQPAAPGYCYWFTGLSGAGKSTLTSHLREALAGEGVPAMVLDGDRLRQGLNSDLGFTRADRRENVRRIAEVARLLVEEGWVVLVSAISPYQEDRQAARERFAPGRFFEVFVATDLATCMARDTKGLYARAQAGTLPHLTGWNDPYEVPLRPEFTIETTDRTVRDAAAPLCRHALALTQERVAHVSGG
ncbi:adenylyl-sulfate kinase [Ralstonia pseudosolanacearum]